MKYLFLILMLFHISCEKETIAPEIPFVFTVEQIGDKIEVNYDQSPKIGWKLYKAPTEQEVQNPDPLNTRLVIITGNGTGCTALLSTAYWWYNCHRVVSDDGEIDHTICLH